MCCYLKQRWNIIDVVTTYLSDQMSNFFAQPDALAYGKTVAELVAEGVPAHLHAHKEFPGNRPSLSILFPELNAYVHALLFSFVCMSCVYSYPLYSSYSCGQLLALYEHRVAVQGFVWGLNSFDQWGVELGKVLANKVRLCIILYMQCVF